MNNINRNISVPFAIQAKEKGKAIALSHQTGGRFDEISFEELERLSNRLAGGLSASGITRGTKTLLMVKPGIPFVATTFALFKAGAVPVFIDPGMGIPNLLNAVRQVAPEAFVGITKAHILRTLFGRHFRSVSKLVTIGPKLFWGGETYDSLLSKGSDHFEPLTMNDDDISAIIFTTGSTGPAKGVTYTHGMYQSQLEVIRTAYNVTSADVDLSAFPLFALFAVALGMRSVIPDMDPTRPAKVNPQNIVDAVNKQKVTFTFGSPAVWGKVSAYCAEKGIKLPSLTRVLMAGAPVAKDIHSRLLTSVLPQGAETHTPYGATEALPIANMTGSEVISETGELTAKGNGICVGRPLPGAEIKIIPLTEEPIASWDPSTTLPPDTKGEIAVKGSMVSRQYYGLKENTLASKIEDGPAVWHRMGDVGYFDYSGRLWFCGRKNHRIITHESTLYSVCCEAIFNVHPSVLRSAIVGLGSWPRQRPVIIIELMKNGKPHNMEKIRQELLALAEANPLTNLVKDVLFHPEFPTDIRHNAKIFREKLKVWAEEQLPERIPA